MKLRMLLVVSCGGSAIFSMTKTFAEPQVKEFSEPGKQKIIGTIGKYNYSNGNSAGEKVNVSGPAIKARPMPDPMSLLQRRGSAGQAASSPIMPTTLLGVSTKHSNSTTLEANGSQGKRKTGAGSRLVKEGGGFVPPPPPSVPSVLVTSGFTGLPYAPEYMNKDELSQKSKEVGLDLDDAKSKLKEKQSQALEGKEKAERFVSLFQEGVVSKHELEAAAKDAQDSDKEIERAKLRVAELESEQKALQRRLAEFVKRPVPAAATNRGHRKH